MKSDERRKSIVNLLLSEKRAVSGSELAEKYDVSRQIIVKDISILKEQGLDYTALTSSSSALLSAKMVSEDVIFQIDLLDDHINELVYQSVGLIRLSLQQYEYPLSSLLLDRELHI